MSILKTVKSWFSSSNRKSSNSSIKFGVVNYYNRSKGYGFIESQDLKERVFLHISNADKKLKIGDPVSFTLAKNEKGFIAENVKKVTD